jgi:coiled-coil and C2 domain-containing protein 2A
MAIIKPAHLQNKHNEEVRRAAGGSSVMINGHILAVPFSDRYADAVAEAVLNTGIHKIADDRWGCR